MSVEPLAAVISKSGSKQQGEQFSPPDVHLHAAALEVSAFGRPLPGDCWTAVNKFLVELDGSHDG